VSCWGFGRADARRRSLSVFQLRDVEESPQGRPTRPRLRAEGPAGRRLRARDAGGGEGRVQISDLIGTSWGWWTVGNAAGGLFGGSDRTSAGTLRRRSTSAEGSTRCAAIASPPAAPARTCAARPSRSSRPSPAQAVANYPHRGGHQPQRRGQVASLQPAAEQQHVRSTFTAAHSSLPGRFTFRS